MGKSQIWDMPKDEIQKRVNKCNSICDMLEAFGYKKTSGSMAQLMKKVISEYEIDISHFTPYKRTNQRQIYSMDEILVRNSKYTNIDRLKRRIVKENILEYKCQCCGNKGEWNGKPLVLQLDHIDGNHTNHSIENLRFLCPNCHSQTETFCGKNANYRIKNT